MAAVPSRAHLAWPFFGPAERDFRDRLDAALAAGAADGGRSSRHRRQRARLRAPAGRGGPAPRLRSREPWRARPTPSIRGCSAWRARGWPIMTGWRISPSPCRGWAAAPSALPARNRCRHRSCRRSPAGEWIAAFALSEAAAGSDVAAMTMEARARGRELHPHGREDLDLQRRHRRCLHRGRAHGRGPGRARPLGLRRLRR